MHNRSFAPPGRRGQLAVVAAGMSAFLDMYVTQALLPTLQHTFHASMTAVGLTVTTTTLAVAFAAPFVGSLSDRFGRRTVLFTSLMCLTGCTLMTATAVNLGWMLFWRLLQGLFIPGVFTTTVAYIGEEWPLERVPIVTALYVSGTVFGSFCGRFLAGLITARYDWKAAFLTLGIVNLFFIPFIAVSMPASHRFRPSPHLTASLSGLGNHLSNHRLIATYAIGFGVLFSQVATFTYVAFYLTAPPLALTLHALSFIYCVFLIGMVITPFAGALAARFGHRLIFALAMGFGSFGLLLTMRPSLPMLAAGLTLSSGGVFVAQAMATSLISRLVSQNRSLAVGLYVLCYYLGGSVGAIVPSLIWEQAGWVGCVVLVILTQMIIGAVAWWTWAFPVTRGALTSAQTAKS